MVVRLIGVLVVALVFCPGGPALAQSAVAAMPQRAANAAAVAMTNQDVVKLVTAGFTDELIVAVIGGAAKTAFDLSPGGLVVLKKAGVSEAVIGAMLRWVAAPRAQESAAARTAPASGEPAGRPGEPSSDIVPPEVGLYVRVAGELVEIRPEIVNWRTGGMLKRMATAGLAGGHVNGWIATPRSPNRVTLPVEIIIYAPEGTSVSEYQLLRFDEKSSRREFRMMSTSMVGARSGADVNLIEFGSERVAARTYLIRLENLPHGEYGFLPPGLTAAGLAASGKVYSFSIR